MKRPTVIRAGVVAKEGIAEIIGENTSDTKKRTATVRLVRPVFPPSATPEADSTNVVTVDVPKTAPAVVATASAIRAPLILGSFPSLSTNPAFVDTPISVPSVSKRSTKRNENTTTAKSRENIFEKSSFAKPGAIDGGVEIMPEGIREYTPFAGSTT